MTHPHPSKFPLTSRAPAALALALALLAAGCGTTEDDKTETKKGAPDIWSFELGHYSVDKPGSTLCNPCASSISCDGADDPAPACVDYGVAGGFCGIKCLVDTDCPAAKEGDVAYECKDAKTVEGSAGKYCVPKQAAGDIGDYGRCRCSAWASSEALSTPCSVDFTGKDGKKVACAGSRTCTEAGLTDCVADVPPSEEICDHIDNDCDGQMNEDTCDDGNPCTSDVCIPWKGCVFTPVAAVCHDGNVCTESDKCMNGKCSGTPKKCNDGDPCTTDACDPVKGCTTAPAEGAPCDDGDLCTHGDACKEGKCAKGLPKVCDDGNACTEDLCHQKSGECIFSEEPLACEDGDLCTESDKCLNGKCQAGTNKVCDDSSKCTDDSCKSDTGCVFLPNGATGCDG